MNRVNVICLKWGTLYSSDYVNRLYAGVKKHLSRPFRFVCVTDDAQGITAEVECVPLPPDPGMARSWPNTFVKLLLFKDGFAGLQGTTLFLDLDVVITDSIDCFFDFWPGRHCMIHNWVEWHKQIFRKREAIGNSSVFRFEAGKSNYVYEKFIEEKDCPDCAHKFTGNSQRFQTYACRDTTWWPDEWRNNKELFKPEYDEDIVWWPEQWVRSFKLHCVPVFPLNLICQPRLPSGCRILTLHGHPNPDQAITG